MTYYQSVREYLESILGEKALQSVLNPFFSNSFFYSSYTSIQKSLRGSAILLNKGRVTHLNFFYNLFVNSFNYESPSVSVVIGRENYSLEDILDLPIVVPKKKNNLLNSPLLLSD